MFLLVTGASGVGKSTVRRLIGDRFGDAVICAELGQLGMVPEWSLNWRHRAVERAVQKALEAQESGKHFVLCGDPVPPGEVYAAPSAVRLAALAICLLDVSAEAQESRLRIRGDDPKFIPHHVAFATWMREHMQDHLARPEVIMNGGWSEMQWSRWLTLPPGETPWVGRTVDTSALSPEEVAQRVVDWIEAQIGNHLPPENYDT